MNLCNREPRFEDMLADSIVQALMESDGVDPRELEADLRRTAALLRAAVRTEKSPVEPPHDPKCFFENGVEYRGEIPGRGRAIAARPVNLRRITSKAQ